LQDFVRGRGDFPLLSPVGGSTLTEGFEALSQIERAQGGHRITKGLLAGVDEKRMYPLWATLDHVDRLRDCPSSESAWETLTETFPELLEIQEEIVRHKDGNPQEIAAAYVQMYLTYVTEWERFPLGALATTM
jgi:hypothetical protein